MEVLSMTETAFGYKTGGKPSPMAQHLKAAAVDLLSVGVPAGLFGVVWAIRLGSLLGWC